MTPPMLDVAASTATLDARPQLEQRPNRITAVLFFAVLVLGLLFTVYSLVQDMDGTGTVMTT